MKKLSVQEIELRKPLSIDILIDARNETVHEGVLDRKPRKVVKRKRVEK